MDICRNVTVSGEYHQQEQVLSPLDDLLSAQNMEVDVGLEWLSVFVEDCFSSTGNCLPAPTINGQSTTIKPPKTQEIPSSLQKFVIPGKARSKRKRVTSTKTRNPLTSWSCSPQNLHFASSDPPMLQQAYWLADSELFTPKKEDSNNNNNKVSDSEVQEETREVEVEEDPEEKVVVRSSSSCSKDSLGVLENSGGQQPRRCTHCLAQKTPQWRAGPSGPKTLCNACGVRYKSGRLLPEYRPAKSPTFVSYLHSNSHKKVMEMRMASSAVFHS